MTLNDLREGDYFNFPKNETLYRVYSFEMQGVYVMNIDTGFLECCFYDEEINPP